jgi:hypothetical protein
MEVIETGAQRRMMRLTFLNLRLEYEFSGATLIRYNNPSLGEDPYPRKVFSMSYI